MNTRHVVNALTSFLLVLAVAGPAELHIFAKAGHGFGASPTLDPNNRHVGDWLNRAYAAIGVFGFR